MGGHNHPYVHRIAHNNDREGRHVCEKNELVLLRIHSDNGSDDETFPPLHGFYRKGKRIWALHGFQIPTTWQYGRRVPTEQTLVTST